MRLQLLGESELPEGWALLPLSEVRQKKSQSMNPLKEPDSTFELYSVPSHETKRPEIAQGQAIGSNKQFVDPEDVLLSKINPRLNRAWVVGDFSKHPKIASAEWVVFKAEENGVAPLYLCHLLQQIKLRDFLCQNASGVGGSLTRVKPSLFDNVEIGLPPLNEQHRIVAKIEELFSELEKGVESLKTAREQLKVYRQSVLKAAFEGRLTENWRKEHADELESANELLARIKAEREARYAAQLAEWQQSGGLIDGKKALPAGRQAPKPKKPKELPPLTADELADLPELPEGWRWVSVNQISNSIQYGYTESSTDKEVGPRFLRITDIQDNKVNWSEVPFCPISDDKKGGYLLKSGDFVFARTGATVGKSFLIKGEIPEAIFASYLIRVRFEGGVSGEFVANFFQSLAYWAQVTEGQVGIGQPNVNGTKLGQLLIPLVGQSEQHQIVQEIESRFSVVEKMEQTIEESLQKAEALRQSILKRAFEGKLVPQDPADEPASELLARIRAEKEAATNIPKQGRKKA